MNPAILWALRRNDDRAVPILKKEIRVICYSSQQWSYLIRQREGRCYACRGTENLHAHHIKSKYYYPDLRLDLSNGAALCSVCHSKFHAYVWASDCSDTTLRFFKDNRIYQLCKSRIRNLRTKRKNRLFMKKEKTIFKKKKNRKLKSKRPKIDYSKIELPHSSTSNIAIIKCPPGSRG